MASCVVPDCHCSQYKLKHSDEGFFTSCRLLCGCGHTQSLHRTPSATDALIFGELASAASVSCCGLISISELPHMTQFCAHDLIPIPPDEMDSEVANVSCNCHGFVCSDVGNLLLKYSTDADIHDSLPYVGCTKCTHPLLMHQHNYPSPHHANHSLLQLKSTVSSNGWTLPNDKLIKLTTRGSTMMLVALVVKEGVYKLICHDIPVEAGKKIDVKRRRSARLTGKTGFEEDNERMTAMIEKLSSSLTNALTTAISLPQDIDVHQPTCLCMTWYNDHTHQLMVAIGTSQGNVVVIYPHVMSSFTIKQDNAVTMLSSNNNSLLIGTCNGDISLYSTSQNKLHSTVHTSQCVTTSLWRVDEQYIVVGTESGDVILYSIKDLSITFCQQISCCSGPVTCLLWTPDNKSILVGSADNCVHILTMTSSEEKKSTHSILSYFTTRGYDKMHYSTVLKGHQSFVGGLTYYQSYVVSIGWDGLVILWSIEDIANASSSEIEPVLAYKLGPQHYVTMLPTGIWSISGDAMLLIAFQDLSKQLVFDLY